jgi:hypothetical protein
MIIISYGQNEVRDSQEIETTISGLLNQKGDPKKPVDIGHKIICLSNTSKSKEYEEPKYKYHNQREPLNSIYYAHHKITSDKQMVTSDRARYIRPEIYMLGRSGSWSDNKSTPFTRRCWR